MPKSNIPVSGKVKFPKWATMKLRPKTITIKVVDGVRYVKDCPYWDIHEYHKTRSDARFTKQCFDNYKFPCVVVSLSGKVSYKIAK